MIKPLKPEDWPADLMPVGWVVISSRRPATNRLLYIFRSRCRTNLLMEDGTIHHFPHKFNKVIDLNE